jgi:hypothetical protein
MGSMQCNVEFGYQLSICSWDQGKTTENLNGVGRSQDLPVRQQVAQFVPHGKHTVPISAASPAGIAVCITPGAMRSLGKRRHLDNAQSQSESSSAHNSQQGQPKHETY